MTATAKVAVVGAGPAALAAAHRLRSEHAVDVLLVAKGGVSEYLPGALPVVTGDAAAEDFRVPVRLDGVEVMAAAVEALDGRRIRVEGRDVPVDAVVVAPGLATVPVGSGGGGRPAVVGFWDVSDAARAASVVSYFESGVVTVVIAGPLYRCPPAPYGLAIRLARRARRLGLDVSVRLTTPEPRPLEAIGTAVTDLLLGSCAEAGVEIDFEVALDLSALAAGDVVRSDGEVIEADLAVVVPLHRASPLVAELAGPNQLVEVDGQGRCAATGVYVAGDAIASPFPRAVAPAIVSGVAAAEGALVDLGVIESAALVLPEPDCFVDRGDGEYSRIQISYPDGAPPVGRPAVVVSGPTAAAIGGFDEATARWRHACGAL